MQYPPAHKPNSLVTKHHCSYTPSPSYKINNNNSLQNVTPDYLKQQFLLQLIFLACQPKNLMELYEPRPISGILQLVW